MKQILIITLSIFFNYTFSQSFNMSNGTISTCSGNFYDDGGNNGNYSSDTSLTYTICATDTNFKIETFFSVFLIEKTWDDLCIYDGNDTSAQLIGCFTDSSLQQKTISSTNSCLTFLFHSDATIDTTGWEATIKCIKPCQKILPKLDSTSLNFDPLTNVINICIGDSIHLEGSATFPQNGLYYNQSQANTSYKWLTGLGKSKNGKNITQQYNSPGANGIYLIVEDSNKCSDTLKVGTINSSLPANYSNITYSNNDTLCLGDSTIIQFSSIETTKVNPIINFNSDGISFLPDGNGQSYNRIININVFDSSSSYQKNFIESIGLTIEHSYLGDLAIKLISPNNDTVILKQYPGGYGTHLGEPIDTGIFMNSGRGYYYEFVNTNNTYSTMVNESGNYQHNYTDSIGKLYLNQDYLPSGSYLSYESFDSLINSPLNGDWKLEITDYVASDDGYIFDWNIKFANEILPDTNANYLLPLIDSSWWAQNTNIDTYFNDSTILVTPSIIGNNTYKIFNKNSIGCINETTINIYLDTSNCINNVGINEGDINNNFTLYPNPTNGDITLSFNEQVNNGVISIYNVNGKKVLSTNFKQTKSLVFNTSELPNGIYFIKLQNNNEVLTQKFIKQ